MGHARRVGGKLWLGAEGAQPQGLEGDVRARVVRRGDVEQACSKLVSIVHIVGSTVSSVVGRGDVEQACSECSKATLTTATLITAVPAGTLLGLYLL